MGCSFLECHTYTSLLARRSQCYWALTMPRSNWAYNMIGIHYKRGETKALGDDMARRVKIRAVRMCAVKCCVCVCGLRLMMMT